MGVDWARLRAVVIQSDDWGFCAWVPDEEAHRALAKSSSFRSPAGRIYGRSTLESAADVAEIAQTLLEFRGGDGLLPVWQANTVMAAPDFERMVSGGFDADPMPIVALPETPSRWNRPGLWDEVRRAEAAGLWWAELHGLHHVPETAWLAALRRGNADARRAIEQQVLVCEAVEASGEYDPTESAATRARNLELAVERFRTLFGRAPGSLCPPDYRWDDSLEEQAERLGVTIIQGREERVGPLLRLRRLLTGPAWPNARGRRFYMPRRIAFEPRGEVRGRLGADNAHRRARIAWAAGRPAVVSTHRVNYAHLDPAWSEAGREALRDLLRRLTADGAMFLTDFEARSLAERETSVRPVGDRGAIARCYASAGATLRLAAAAGVTGGTVLEGRGGGAEIAIEGAEALLRLEPGEYFVEWRHG